MGLLRTLAQSMVHMEADIYKDTLIDSFSNIWQMEFIVDKLELFEPKKKYTVN